MIFWLIFFYCQTERADFLLQMWNFPTKFLPIWKANQTDEVSTCLWSAFLQESRPSLQLPKAFASWQQLSEASDSFPKQSDSAVVKPFYKSWNFLQELPQRRRQLPLFSFDATIKVRNKAQTVNLYFNEGIRDACSTPDITDWHRLPPFQLREYQLVRVGWQIWLIPKDSRPRSLCHQCTAAVFLGLINTCGNRNATDW